MEQVNRKCAQMLECHTAPDRKLINALAKTACLQVCAGRFANPYKLLDLKPDADLRQIKRAYRKKALQHHPDINDSPDAEEMFIAVQEAYQVLTGRGKPSEDPEAARGESWDFHDWYWDFLMGRRHNRKWDSSGRQGPPPFVAQPSTRHQVQEQLGGLRRKAAARQAKLRCQGHAVGRQGQAVQPAEDSAVAYAAKAQANTASLGTSKSGQPAPASRAAATGNAAFTRRFVAKTRKALAHTQRQSRQEDSLDGSSPALQLPLSGTVDERLWLEGSVLPAQSSNGAQQHLELQALLCLQQQHQDAATDSCTIMLGGLVIPEESQHGQRSQRLEADSCPPSLSLPHPESADSLRGFTRQGSTGHGKAWRQVQRPTSAAKRSSGPTPSSGRRTCASIDRQGSAELSVKGDTHLPEAD
eukprot:jgi/Astpho2/164/fgenesh1_pg.00004_%23_63_t